MHKIFAIIKIDTGEKRRPSKTGYFEGLVGYIKVILQNYQLESVPESISVI